MTQPVTAEPIWINEHFKIEAPDSCLVLGYLIVSPKLPVSSLSAMSVDALALLGPTLAVVTKAVTAVVHAERVYCSLLVRAVAAGSLSRFPTDATAFVRVSQNAPNRD